MARAYRTEGQKASKVLTARLTEAEYDLAKRVAHERGLTLSGLVIEAVRTACGATPGTSTEFQAALLGVADQIRRVGRNINQIAARNNSRGSDTAGLGPALNEIKSLLGDVASMVLLVYRTDQRRDV